MKSVLMGVLLLGTACGVCAQEAGLAVGRTDAGASFSGSPTSPAGLFATTTAAGGSFALASTGGESSAMPAAEPAARPKYIFGERDDYRWQLELGVEYFRFRSNIFDASLVGTNTTLTYFTNSWFAWEGSVVTGFAPEIYDREHVKLFGGGGGIRIGGRRARWEPFGHALVGGSHLQPQTADHSRNSLMAQAGAGVDFRLHARLSLRAEGDWVYTQYFGHMQNNFQGNAGIVLHF